jgi:ubiquitin conjugation factor E4 B
MFAETFPQIRMKRLAKLQASSTSATPSPSASSPPPQPPAPSLKPKPPPAPTPRPAEAPTPALVPPRKKAHIAPSPFYYDVWENETIGQVFQVTLDVRLFLQILGHSLVVLTSIRGGQPAESMKNEFEYVWLKSAVESESSDGNSTLRLSVPPVPYEYTGNLRLTSDNLESVVITRLELDPLSPE